MDASDTDFYQVKSGSAASLTVTMNPAPRLRPSIAVYGPNRAELSAPRLWTGGAILEHKFDVQPNTVYYVEVKSSDNSGAYTLAVK